MNKEEMKCIRCKGRKKIYKIMGGYSYINTGGIISDCPMCNGKGTVKTIAAFMEDLKKGETDDGRKEPEIQKTEETISSRLPTDITGNKRKSTRNKEAYTRAGKTDEVLT